MSAQLFSGPAARPARIVRLATPLIAASLALTACGGGSSDDTSDKGAGSTSASAPAKPESWPLTGVQAPLGTTTKLDHPAIVVKMDNTEASAPQLGLSKADLVTEELVEGGLTRLAAFFYSTIPGTVGPVRSMRASDIGIVTPVKADVVTSGAAPVTISRIKKAGITFYGEGSKGFFRDNSRHAPYNLFSQLTKTITLAKQEPQTVPDYLSWGTESDFVGVEPVTQLAVPFSYSHTTQWKYDGSKYVNLNSNAKKGDEFTPDTILVLRVKIGDAGYLDPAGNPVPETKLVGTGKALVFHKGQLERATWTKSDLGSPIQLSTEAGALKIPAGHTWIELVPDNGAALTMKP
ncbi:DUF3048 domain-containing protein [Nocardioides sp. Kera G14]|uniref:DUF3048 domain-containing protein n=1 Tax=Nocardioides sp. Kera G14 TaxID=2884264 RepID=UPI001D12D00C|nr:DUF3048 domain-containing protein [Nocardioides sp. Kera G14]UDY22796.1 DUF3048 domain-containing protein [Nocardioides sp. Kera G14]